MRTVVYLFKTDGESFHIKLKDKNTNTLNLVYGINPIQLPKYNGKFEMRDMRIQALFIDKTFETEKWFWTYYMPALSAGGGLLYNIISKE